MAVLAEFGLVFDLLIEKEQIPAATALAASLPQVRFNLNHLGYPAIGNASALATWTKDITALGPPAPCSHAHPIDLMSLWAFE